MFSAEQISQFRKDAEAGNADAQRNLGWAYQNGEGVAKNAVEAVKWFRAAADQGSAVAQNDMGWMFETGQGVTRDGAQAAEWYRRAAAQGEVFAQNNLGRLYESGVGVTQDLAEATRLFRKAAEHGLVQAQRSLGWAYQNGKGVPQSDTDAVLWYRKAAEQGYAIAQNDMGWMCHTGKGTPANDKEAVEWYRRSAEQGYAYAQHNLGWMYENGKGVHRDVRRALTWYCKAAEQGHAPSKESVTRVQKSLQSAAPVDGKAGARPDVEEDGRHHAKRKHVEAYAREEAECQALLDACVPEIYIRNAFRIMGLMVDAGKQDIGRRLDDLEYAEEKGESATEHRHAFALEPPPTFEQVRLAARRLEEPRVRIVEEFFWFWPNQWSNSRSDPALVALSNGDKDTAFKVWRDALSDGHPATAVASKHNLAVMYQMVALDSECYALNDDLTPEQCQTIEKYWRTAFQWWEELTEDEVFWSFVTERIRLLNESDRLQTGFARQMRKTLPVALDKINAILAVRFAERGKFPLAAKHVRYMQETHAGQDDVPKTLAMVTKPLNTRVTCAVEKATTAAVQQPKSAANSARELLEAIEEPVKILWMILPEGAHERTDLADSVAEACLKCQIAYARETEDWATSLQILDAARKYAVSAETKRRVEDNRRIVANNRLLAEYLDPLTKMIEGIDTKTSIAAKVAAVESEVLPLLRSVEGLKETAEVYGECADFVARYLRGLSVSAYNDATDLPTALRTLEIALTVVHGKATREQLEKDKLQLADLLAQSEKHSATVEMRNDVVEVTPEYVQYKGRRLSNQDIIGIRFGIYKHYTNGIPDTTSYLIGLGSAQTSLVIECNRFLRSEAKIQADFNRILGSLFYQVVPGIVSRVSTRIVSGTPYHIGGCRVAADGILLHTGALMWKKEHFVPWCDIRHESSQGSLTVYSGTNPKISETCSLRDAWNAVIFEFIAKAVVDMTWKRGAGPRPASRG